MTKVTALIEANLSVYNTNPVFDFGDGNIAVASKWFSEELERWVYSISCGTEGRGVFVTQNFASFEALLERMEEISSGNLSLWEIDETAARTEAEDAAADVERTSKVVEVIEANLSVYRTNPILDFGNGNTAKASSGFSEKLNQWVYIICYYAKGQVSVSKFDRFDSFEALIERMKELASGDLSLWEIDEE